MIGKNLKKVGLTAILTIGIFVLFGCSIKLDVPTKDIEAVKETTIGTLAKVPEKYKDRAEILNADEKVELTTLGKKEITYKVKDKESGEEGEVKVEFNIVDTTGPEIKCKDKIETVVGKKFDINKHAKAEDIVDGKIDKIDVSGEVNTKKKGSYELTLSAEDKSGNKSEKKVTVKVIDKPMTLEEFFNLVGGTWDSDAYYYHEETDQKIENYELFFAKDEGGYRFWIGRNNSPNIKNGYADNIKQNGNIITLKMRISNQSPEGLQRNYTYNESGVVKIVL